MTLFVGVKKMLEGDEDDASSQRQTLLRNALTVCYGNDGRFDMVKFTVFLLQDSSSSIHNHK